MPDGPFPESIDTDFFAEQRWRHVWGTELKCEIGKGQSRFRQLQPKKRTRNLLILLKLAPRAGFESAFAKATAGQASNPPVNSRMLDR